MIVSFNNLIRQNAVRLSIAFDASATAVPATKTKSKQNESSIDLTDEKLNLVHQVKVSLHSVAVLSTFAGEKTM